VNPPTKFSRVMVFCSDSILFVDGLPFFNVPAANYPIPAVDYMIPAVAYLIPDVDTSISFS
jgi:hypothetical protein